MRGHLCDGGAGASKWRDLVVRVDGCGSRIGGLRLRVCVGLGWGEVDGEVGM